MWWVYFDVSSEAGSRKIQEVKDPGKLGLIYNAIHIVLVGALIICAVGDEQIVAHPEQEMRAEVVFVLIIDQSFIFWQIVSINMSRAVCFLYHILCCNSFGFTAPWPYHISLLTMNILVTSVFIFVIVFDMLFPNKGFKIKWEPKI